MRKQEIQDNSMEQDRAEVDALLRPLIPISLEEMDYVRLMNRMDTKFIFHYDHLQQLLPQAASHYKILEINNKRILNYQTTYFDTPQLTMYMAHHNGRLNRYKVRYRRYVDTDTGFLEIKFKTNKGRTIKERIKQKSGIEMFREKEWNFIKEHTPFHTDTLQPELSVDFSRFTLVHKSDEERMTIDLNLTCRYKDHKCSLPFLVICEVKQSKASIHSDFIRLLRNRKIFPYNLSKYCIGTALLKQHIKRNRFKEKLLFLNKISHDSKSNVFIKN